MEKSIKTLNISNYLFIASLIFFFIRKIDFLLTFCSSLFRLIFHPLLVFVLLALSLALDLATDLKLYLIRKKRIQAVSWFKILIFWFLITGYTIESFTTTSLYSLDSALYQITKESALSLINDNFADFSPYTIPNKKAWETFMCLGRTKEALFNYDATFSYQGYGVAYFVQAQASLGQGDIKKAEYYFEKYSNCGANESLLNLFKAKLFYHQGKIKTAFKYAKKSENESSEPNGGEKAKILKENAEKNSLYYKAAEFAQEGRFHSSTKALIEYLKYPLPDIYLIDRLKSDPNYRTYTKSKEFESLVSFYEKIGLENLKKEFENSKNNFPH